MSDEQDLYHLEQHQTIAGGVLFSTGDGHQRMKCVACHVGEAKLLCADLEGTHGTALSVCSDHCAASIRSYTESVMAQHGAASIGRQMSTTIPLSYDASTMAQQLALLYHASGGETQVGDARFDERRQGLHRAVKATLVDRQTFDAANLDAFLALGRKLVTNAHAKSDKRAPVTASRDRGDMYHVQSLSINLCSVYETFIKHGAFKAITNLTVRERITFAFTSTAMLLQSGTAARDIMLGVFTWSLDDQVEDEPIDDTIDGPLDRLRTSRAVSKARALVPSSKRAYSVQDMVTELELLHLNMTCSELALQNHDYMWGELPFLLYYQYLSMRESVKNRSAASPDKTLFEEFSEMMFKQTDTDYLNYKSSEKKQPTKSKTSVVSKEAAACEAHNKRQANLYGLVDNLDHMIDHYYDGPKNVQRRSNAPTKEELVRREDVKKDWTLMYRTLASRIGSSTAQELIRTLLGSLVDVSRGADTIDPEMLKRYRYSPSMPPLDQPPSRSPPPVPLNAAVDALFDF